MYSALATIAAAMMTTMPVSVSPTIKWHNIAASQIGAQQHDKTDFEQTTQKVQNILQNGDVTVPLTTVKKCLSMTKRTVKQGKGT